MSHNRSQVAVIVLWVLIILTMLAVSVGHRVSLGLRLNRYQRDGLKAHYLAKAGVVRAIAELEKDNNKDIDYLGESWSTGLDTENNKLFENIEVRQNSGESFTVQYLYDKVTDEYRCTEDEDRKVNSNGCDLRQLEELFMLRVGQDGTMVPADITLLAQTIIDWIDADTEKTAEPGVAEDPVFKNTLLKSPEELRLVLEYFYSKKNEPDYQAKAQALYLRIEDIITVYTDSKVNLNTVGSDALEIVLKGLYPSASLDQTLNEEITAFINSINNFRGAGNYFDTANTADDIIGKLASSGVTISDPQRIDIIPKLFTKIKIKSEYFRIESTGKAGLVTKKITAVVKRAAGALPELRYWHES